MIDKLGIYHSTYLAFWCICSVKSQVLFLKQVFLVLISGILKYMCWKNIKTWDWYNHFQDRRNRKSGTVNMEIETVKDISGPSDAERMKDRNW